MGQECVCHGSDLVVSPVYKAPFWVSHKVFIILSMDIEDLQRQRRVTGMEYMRSLVG